MAKRGTSKRRSQDHEKWIANLYGGTVSPSSGGASNDNGDVRCPDQLIECKTTGGPGEKSIQRPGLLRIFEKVAEEAYSEGRNPMVALRYYLPDSKLASKDGWVDLIVRLAEDDYGY